MAHITSKILWAQSLPCDFGINVLTLLHSRCIIIIFFLHTESMGFHSGADKVLLLSCSSKEATLVASLYLFFFYPKKKKNYVATLIIWDLFLKKQIVTPFVCSDDQLGDILKKLLANVSFNWLSFKLGMFDLYALIKGGVWGTSCYCLY